MIDATLELDLNRLVGVLHASIADDACAPALYELMLPDGRTVTLTTRSAVGRYVGHADAVIVSIVVRDLRGETDLSTLDAWVDTLRAAIPPALRESVTVLDDASLVFADLKLGDVSDAVILQFLVWVALHQET